MDNIDFSYDQEEAFANAEAGGSTYDKVPDGIYDCRIDAVELTATKEGEPCFQWTLVIEAPSSIGRKLWKRQYFAANQMPFFKKDLALCGLYPQSLSELKNPAVLERLLNIKVKTQAKMSGKYQNYYFQKRIDNLNPQAGSDDEPMDNIAPGDLPF